MLSHHKNCNEEKVKGKVSKEEGCIEMGKKTRAAKKRISSGEFRVPSPDEVEACKTVRGAWTAAQLAQWGVPWPPPHGWRYELRLRWHEFGSVKFSDPIRHPRRPPHESVEDREPPDPRLGTVFPIDQHGRTAR